MSNRASEIDSELFDRIAPYYVRKDLIGYCRLARKMRLDSTLQNISKPISSILEIGCGAGFTADYLQGQYTRYLGVDQSQRLIDYANKHNRYENTSFICSNIEHLSIREKYQVVLMIGVLHHLHDVKKVLFLLKELVRKNGVVVVNEPQRGNPFVSLLRAFRKKLDHRYSSDQIEFGEKEFRALFCECGYKIRVLPQGFLSTPLAETLFLPSFVGLPLVFIAKLLDPVLERLFNAGRLRKWSWNIVVEAKL